MLRGVAMIVLLGACAREQPPPPVRPPEQGCYPLALRRPPTPGDDQIELPYLEYLARTPEHEWLLVVRAHLLQPMRDARVFFGPSHAVKEMTLHGFSRQRDGGTTTVSFTDGHGIVEAHFPVRCKGAPPDPRNLLRTRMDCPGVLRDGEVEQPLQRFELDPPDYLAFECRSPVDFRDAALGL